MMLDVVNVFNGVTDAMWRRPNRKRRKMGGVEELADDPDGTVTVSILGKD